jgi:hypothetical protein
MGDLLIVSSYTAVNPLDLIVTAFGKKLLARRYNETDVHPTMAVLTGQAIDPYSLPQPVIAPLERITPKKIVGTIFRPHSAPLPSMNEDNEIVALTDTVIVRKALENARLFQVDGRSAEPIALDKQFLITHQVTFNAESVMAFEGRLVIAIDEHGTRYFKRLRAHGNIIVLESLNPDGTTPAELLSLDGTNKLPKLTGLLAVVGILFELP